MTETILSPLQFADMTPEQAYRFGIACALYVEAGEPAPIDYEGYVLYDDVTEYVLGADIELDPHRR